MLYIKGNVNLLCCFNYLVMSFVVFWFGFGDILVLDILVKMLVVSEIV